MTASVNPAAKKVAVNGYRLRVRHARYLDVLREIIEQTRADFLHVQVSEEMLAISGSRERLGTRTFLPRHETVVVCEDKFSRSRSGGVQESPCRRRSSSKTLPTCGRHSIPFGPKLRVCDFRLGRTMFPTDR